MSASDPIIERLIGSEEPEHVNTEPVVVWWKAQRSPGDENAFSAICHGGDWHFITPNLRESHEGDASGLPYRWTELWRHLASAGWTITAGPFICTGWDALQD